MADSIRINTTQNVRLSFELATLGDRIAAALIDLAVIIGYIFGIFYLMGQEILPSSTAFTIVFLLPVIVYHLLFEVFNNGRSIGKTVLKTRVVRYDGTEPRLGDYVIRWLLGLVELNLGNGSIAVIVVLVNGKGQRLGDILANTTVAKQKKRVTLEQTLFEDVDEDYVPSYPQAGSLATEDIETIKRVLEAFEKGYSAETITLMHKTKNVIKERLSITTPDEGNDRDFLKKVIKDYNFITGKDEY